MSDIRRQTSDFEGHADTSMGGSDTEWPADSIERFLSFVLRDLSGETA